MYSDEYALSNLPNLPAAGTCCARCKKALLLEDLKDFEYDEGSNNYFHRKCSKDPSRNKRLEGIKRFLNAF
jgi:hypothetical protein